MHVVEINGTIYRSLRLAYKELHLITDKILKLVTSDNQNVRID